MNKNLLQPFGGAFQQMDCLSYNRYFKVVADADWGLYPNLIFEWSSDEADLLGKIKL